MPDNKPAEQAGQKAAEQTAANKSETNKPETKPAPHRNEAPARQGDPVGGVAEAMKAAHNARTVVPGHEGIDARLDNRAGRFRPPLEEWPAKPQQVDGPDLAHQAEHTRATLRDLEEGLSERKGQYSIGAHGLGTDESLREGRAVAGPNED